MDSAQEPSQDPKKQKPYNDFLKYSGLGLQLLATIGVAGWLGYKLDGFLGLKFPACMLTLGLAAFAGSLYQVYKSITKE